MAASEVYKSKFPATKQLDACYSDVVPDKGVHHATVQRLEDVLSENKHKFVSHMHAGCCACGSCDEGLLLSERIKELHEELTNQITALQRGIHVQENQLNSALPTLHSLITVSRESPSIVACVLGKHSQATPTVVSVRRYRPLHCAWSKGTCCERALPFSRFCLKHISHNRHQVLYRSCVAIDKSSLTQCSEPVLDILSEESFCPRHAVPVGGDNPVGGRPPPRKKISLQQSSRPQTGWVGGVGGVASGGVTVKQVKKSATGRSASSKEATPTVPHPQSDSQKGASTTKASRNTSSRSRTLDDLLTLSPALPAPLPTLDLAPLKADIGEIMMAGEGSSSGTSSSSTSDNEGEEPGSELTHLLT